MLRLVQRTRCPSLVISTRSFSKTLSVHKRTSKLKLSELVVEPPEKKASQPILDHVQISTGSVVLDAVREYTKKYPLCVLLVQVGDFYEVDRSKYVKILY
jgi:DNA mismatch repair protein MutS